MSRPTYQPEEFINDLFESNPMYTDGSIDSTPAIVSATMLLVQRMEDYKIDPWGRDRMTRERWWERLNLDEWWTAHMADLDFQERMDENRRFTRWLNHEGDWVAPTAPALMHPEGTEVSGDDLLVWSEGNLPRMSIDGQVSLWRLKAVFA